MHAALLMLGGLNSLCFALSSGGDEMGKTVGARMGGNRSAGGAPGCSSLLAVGFGDAESLKYENS